MNSIYEKRYFDGYIEYKSFPVVKVTNILIFKRLKEENNLISMRKSYQNNNKEEHDEIDSKLQEIFENNDIFSLNIFDGGYYSCRFLEKPPEGSCIMSAELVGFK